MNFKKIADTSFKFSNPLVISINCEKADPPSFMKREVEL